MSVNTLPMGVCRADVELVSMRTEHGSVIDGALWMPSESPVAAVVHLHGKGGNFYTGPGRWLPALMSGAPIAHLSCNMTCHDLGYTRYDAPEADYETSAAGGMWENLKAGITDIAAMVAYVRDIGIDRIFVAGHSSGGYYTVRYAARDSGLAGRILLSPLMGNTTALAAWFSDGELDAAIRRATELSNDGRGHLLLSLAHWYYGISADSLLERVHDDVSVWDTALAGSNASVLWAWGSAEGRDQAWRVAFDGLRITDKVRVVLDGADHHYVGHEEELARTVARFVLDRA